MQKYLKIILFSTYLFLICSANSFTVLYLITPSDTDFVKPCEGKEDIFILNYFDISNITKYWNDNDELIVNGRSEATFVLDKNEKITLVGEVQIRKFGTWTVTPFNFKVLDLCATLDNPVLLTQQYLNYINEDERHCPYKPRSNYTLTNASPNMKIRLPKAPDGQYRVICNYLSKSFKACHNAEFDVVKYDERN